MSNVAPLRARAEHEAARLPPLLARAEHLAGTVLLGEHGRRRAGLGDDFWQYRPVQAGDERRFIDWRRSARSDAQFVRQREWQIAQSVVIWVDAAASMRFASDPKYAEKSDRARLLALAVAILLNRAGERVGLAGADLPPRRGEAQMMRLAEALVKDGADDYGHPQSSGMLPHGRALFISDFMGDIAAARTALTGAADRGVQGVLLQVLDPAEEAFPYRGRTIFESVGGTLAHETLKASELRDRYLARLAQRKAELQSLCATTGWQYGLHHTSDSAQSALLWLFRAFDGGPSR
ncbi:DUF58 domain-containing protein [Roseovarius sp.]|uniref:DUF58 domain-containing protein n=1 Tax=Roseovarius sp. TaxID=1486281 RepID=UPI00261CFBEE|nr:DUF58 domain-containing protein [Roseovarius sp.]MDM8166122.1 DUF58 domain-containing protein [Roseovarius sp.]